MITMGSIISKLKGKRSEVILFISFIILVGCLISWYIIYVNLRYDPEVYYKEKYEELQASQIKKEERIVNIPAEYKDIEFELEEVPVPEGISYQLIILFNDRSYYSVFLNREEVIRIRDKFNRVK